MGFFNSKTTFNSLIHNQLCVSCCFGCKSTKNLRAIHNAMPNIRCRKIVVSAAKVQKIWEQFTTSQAKILTDRMLFRLQKYKKFESNSQHYIRDKDNTLRCFGCKSTKNLRAIHNTCQVVEAKRRVVSAAKVQKIWEQFTTTGASIDNQGMLFRLQKYKKFESNSQRNGLSSCIDKVVSAAKVQKIWEQFTTRETNSRPFALLFRLQKYKKFESNSQHPPWWFESVNSCFGCKSTKNLRAIHNICR